jgi:hypothetical protein
MADFCPSDLRMDGEQPANEGAFADHLRTKRDHLYFIQADSGPIKIGRAADPRKRLAQLKSGNFEALTLLGQLDGRGYEEKVWHTAFQDDRLTGEWFSSSRELGKAIDAALAGKRWWDFVLPPEGFPFADPEEWDDDCVDWQIAVELAAAEARSGRFSRTVAPTKLLELGEQRIAAMQSALASPTPKDPTP